MAYGLRYHGTFALLKPSNFGKRSLHILALTRRSSSSSVDLNVPRFACLMQDARICAEPALNLNQYSGVLSRLTWPRCAGTPRYIYGA